MADFEINNPVTFTKNVRKFETKDKGHADIFNHVTAALVNNDAYLEESKVDKVEGKGLSTNDYTNADKNKLSGIAEGAEVNVQADWNVSDSNSDAYIKNKPQAMKNPTSLNISLNGISQGAYDGSSQKDVNITAQNVGADSSGTAATKVSEHNASEAAHSDIRELIATLATRFNALANSDDTTLDQLSEIVAYIKSNRSLIENVTTGKVNIGDIIDNLTSSVANKPLSAKQGKVLKDLITALTSTVDGKANKAGDEFTGDVTFDNYIKIKALPGYGTGSANMWFNANTKTIDFNGDVLNIDLNASSVNGMHAWDFVPIYSKDKLYITWDKNAEITANKIEINKIDVRKPTDTGPKYKSVASLDNNKVELNARNIAIKALSYDDLGEHIDGGLTLSVGGIKVFDFGHERISYIRQIGKSPSMMFKDTSTLSTPNHNIFLVNDFGGDYVDLGSNVQAPEYRMICGVNVKNAYLGEIDKSYMSLYSGGSFDLKAFKTGIAVVGDDKTTYIYSNTVKMGKVGNYFMVGATSSLYNHPDNYAYNVKFRNGKGVYLSLENEFTGGNSITINGDVKFVDENDITNFDDNVTDEDKQWLLGTSLQNILIDFHRKTSLATTTSDGLMSASDKKKVDNVLFYDNNIVYMKTNSEIYFDDDEQSYNGNRYQNIINANGMNLKSSCYQEDNDNNIYETGYESTVFNINGISTEGSFLEFDITGKTLLFLEEGFFPQQQLDLGTATKKWQNIYAANGTIQTSDRTKKTNINSLEAQKVQAFIHGLNPVSYKMLDGTSGRTHYGFIAQDIEELMNTLNMDSSDFAGFIKSPKKNIRYEDENGNKLKKPVEEVIENEYDYALRYDEFIAPLIKVVQEQQKTIEQQQRMIEQQQIAIENQQKEIEQIKKDISRIYSSM